jgi:hypothetical protein
MLLEGVRAVKNNNDSAGKRNHDIPTCSTMPQPRASTQYTRDMYIYHMIHNLVQYIITFRYLPEIRDDKDKII